ncbi:MAG: hypothetical protein ACHQVS_02400 [Candidatus Babeliales bacterium]
MNNCVHGSALVAVLVLLSAGIIASFSVWQHTWLLSDVVRSKEIYYQQRYATEGLLLCGCTIASYNKDRIIRDRGKQAVITLPQWPITDTIFGCGTITITAETPTYIQIRSALQVDNHEVCSLMCTLHVPEVAGDSNDDTRAVITAWSTVKS